MLELWFDFSCPFAYLASKEAPDLARAAGVELAWRPMLLGGVFRGIVPADSPSRNGPMATLGAAKARHNYHDMHRWAAIFGVPFQMPAAHPMRTVRALRVLLGLPHSRWPAAIAGLFAAYWERGEDVTRDDVIAAALTRAGTTDADIASAFARADEPDIKDELKRRTDEAIELGVFGAPAWVVRREGREPLLFWGQDRMAWVEAALAGWDPDAGPPPGGSRPFGDGVQGFASARALDVYFDVSSPYAYFALTQLPALARAAGVVPRLHPILLGGLFREIGQVDVPLLSMPPAKLRYIAREMDRWARWWGVPFDMPTKFPQRTIAAQRLCVIAGQHGDALPLATALARAMWADQRDLEDAATLRAILGEVGLPAEWYERTQDPEIKAALVAETAAAGAAGVFGVPAFVVGAPSAPQLVWGQDRLDVVLRMLGGWDAP